MKGIYVLIISVARDIQLRIGSLGGIAFKKGYYAYIGSAQYNLEKRIARHKSKDKKIFWHVDYLLANKSAKIIKVYSKRALKLEECKIANKLSKNYIFIPDFGSSDCNCKSHLFRINNIKEVNL